MRFISSWSLPDFAIRRPITVVMLTVTGMMVGMVCWTKLPLEFIIQLWEPSVWVHIPYPGATPEQVEREIAVPAEGLFKTIPGMKRLEAWSNENYASFALRFAFNSDMALASAEIRDRVERLKLQLPREVEHVSLGRYGPQDIPIMRLAVFREDRDEDLAHYVRTTLRNRLMRVPGVAEVRVSGHDEQSVFVEFNQNALHSLGLPMSQVITALQQSSVNMGIGTLREGDAQYLVRANDRFSTSEELANAVIDTRGHRLRDVAEVSEHQPAGLDTFSVDGKRGVFVNVIRDAQANTVAACEGVRAELEAAKADPEMAGAEFFVFEDQSLFIRFAIDSLYLSGAAGCTLAFIILWLFLRRVRATLLVALAIPASMTFAPIYIYFMGKSLNLITLAAMLVSVGMLVDNAIVVVENIHRHHALYPGNPRNAQRAAREVAMAIAASTLTTLIVFVPVLYMEAGELSTIMKEFAGPITVTLLASLVLSLTVLPMAEHRFGLNQRGGRSLRVPHWLQAAGALSTRIGPLRHLRELYAAGVAAVLRRPFVSLGLVLILLISTWVYPIQSTGFSGFPEMDMRRVSVRFRVDGNYGGERARQDVQRLVEAIELERDVLQVRNVYVNSGDWGGDIDLYLAKAEDLGPGEMMAFTTEEARRHLHQLLPERVPGGRIDCGVPATRPEDRHAVRVHLAGDDLETLRELADAFERQMAGLAGLYNVRSSLENAKDEIQLQVDDVRAAESGIAPELIARSVSFALSGATLPHLHHAGREVPVRGQFDWREGGNLGDLESLAIPGTTGGMVQLAHVVDMERGSTPRTLYRSNARGRVTVEGYTEEKNLLELRAALEDLKGRFSLPAGYTIEVDHNLAGIDHMLESFQLTLYMAIVLIYLLLAAMFESWLLPLSVLTTVPLAFVGVYWSLYLFETPLDTISLVGAVILCGVIVNNGIVIVDHVNGLRNEGMPRKEALLQGGLNRLRPVMMTTLTTILGVLPLALGGTSDGGTGALTGLGRALVGGLAAGTVLTLFVVPLAYMLLDDLRTWCRDFFAGLRGLALGSGHH